MNNITKLMVGDSIGIFSPSSPIIYSCPIRFEDLNELRNIYRIRDLK